MSLKFNYINFYNMWLYIYFIVFVFYINYNYFEGKDYVYFDLFLYLEFGRRFDIYIMKK